MEWLILFVSTGALVGVVVTLRRIRDFEDLFVRRIDEATDHNGQRAVRDAHRRKILRIHNGGW